jgi:hypothetical protein
MPSCSSVMILSLSTIGMPCRGPLTFPRNLSSSNFFAILSNSCFGATDIKARNCLPLRLCCSIWCKYSSTISTHDIACAFSSSESSKAETTRGSNSGKIPMPPSVEDVNDIFRGSCALSGKLLDGDESTVGERALLKNFDALRILPVDSPLVPQIPHVLPAVRSRGDTRLGYADAGSGRSNVERSKGKEPLRLVSCNFMKIQGETERNRL